MSLTFPPHSCAHYLGETQLTEQSDKRTPDTTEAPPGEHQTRPTAQFSSLRPANCFSGFLRRCGFSTSPLRVCVLGHSTGFRGNFLENETLVALSLLAPGHRQEDHNSTRTMRFGASCSCGVTDHDRSGCWACCLSGTPVRSLIEKIFVEREGINTLTKRALRL